jgi:hypothetical protein
MSNEKLLVPKTTWKVVPNFEDKLSVDILILHFEGWPDHL